MDKIPIEDIIKSMQKLIEKELGSYIFDFEPKDKEGNKIGE
jgi:hypothetical protein